MDNSELAASIFNKHAEAYQNKFMDTHLYHESFDEFCGRVVREGSRILELACGPGNITKYLLAKRPDFQIFGIDLSPNMIQLAKQNNPTATFEVMDCRAIGSLNKQYDAVMCGFCMPYLTKEEAIQLIDDATKLLTDAGVIYISTMEDDYSKSGWRTGSAGDQMYMNFHEATYLIDALEKNGFKQIDVRRQDFPEQNGSVMIDLILIANK